jgi:excisionase family DNA binding protein
VPLPPKAADRFRHPSAIVERVRELAHHLTDAQIADRLNRENHVSTKSKPYTRSSIRWIRWRHQIPAPALKKPEELTVQQVAKQFGVSNRVVYDWIDKGMIKARRFNNGTPYWITFSAADEQKLQDWVCNASRSHTGT